MLELLRLFALRPRPVAHMSSFGRELLQSRLPKLSPLEPVDFSEAAEEEAEEQEGLGDLA